MAETTQLDLDQAVVAAAEAAAEYYQGAARRLRIDIQESGEHPYSVEVLDEPVPLGYLAVGVNLSHLYPDTTPAKPNPPQES